MKKIFFILLLIVSCEKSSDCWVCQIRTVKSYVSVISDKTVTFDRCNTTAQDILKFENEQTKTYIEPTNTNTGSIINVNVTTTCKCEKK